MPTVCRQPLFPLQGLLAALLSVLVAPTHAQAQGPKVIVVVAGDPDDAVREAAARADEAIRAADDLRGPADPGLRSVLRGDPAPAEDDGLDRVRTERRRLGFEDPEEARGLRALGRMAGASVVVVVRARGAGPVAEVFDVGAATLYEGELALADATASDIASFVARRANAAARRAGRGELVAPAAVAAEATTETTDPLDGAAEAEESEPGGVRGFLKRTWAYWVAGAVLIGVASFFIIDSRRDDEVPQPVLRFRPGVD